MEDPSQSSAIHENSMMVIPNQTLARARNQTVVVERRRRRILMASKPGLPGSMSYSMVAVEDVEVVRTTTVHSNDVEPGCRTESRHEEYDTDLKKASDVSSKARAATGRARYVNSFQQRHYHYLPNGPARRSRYDVPPKQLKAPPSTVMPPTTHVIHREGVDDHQNSHRRQPSPSPSPYTSHCDTHLRPAPEKTTAYSLESSTTHHSHSPRPRFESKAPATLQSYPSSSTYSPKPKETESFHSRFEYHPSESIEHLESPVSEASNPREGLGSREHELMELREFWKEFYSS